MPATLILADDSFVRSTLDTVSQPDSVRTDGGSDWHVMVVEDVPGQRNTLAKILQHEGFTTLTCETGEKALEAARQNQVAVAILDYRLPDLTGVQVLEGLKATDPRIQGILHTAYGSFDSAKDAVNLGAYGYLEKPSDPAEMVRCVHNAWRHWTSLALDRSQKRQRLLEAALEQAELPIAVTSAGEEARYAYVNPAFTRMCGYSEDELAGESSDLLYGYKTKREVLERMRERRRAGKSFVGEMMFYRKDGSSFLMEVRLDPVREADDEITHWVMIYR